MHPDRRNVLTLELVDSTGNLDSIKDEWDALLRRCPHRTPFLTHEWVSTWWRHFGHGKQLCIYVLRNGARAVAIAPLMRYRGRLYDGFRAPVWIIATIANHHTGRVDLIYTDYRDEYLWLVWQRLRTDHHWHVLRVHPLSEESRTLVGLHSLANAEQLRISITRGERPPYLAISADYPRLLKKCSRSLRRSVRGAEALKADGKISVEFCTGRADVDAVLAQLFAVSEQGWAAEAGTAISSTAQLRGFYADLARVAATRGWLFITVLKSAGKPIAYEYSLRYEQTVYALKVAFDPGFSDWAPGHAVKHFALKEIAVRMPDVRCYDFLGEARPYKMMWPPQLRPLVRASIFRPDSVYARSLHMIHTKFLARAKRAPHQASAGRGREVFLSS